MRLLVGLSTLLAVVSCSSVQFTAIPNTLGLPDGSATIRSSQLDELNENILGLTSKPIASFPVNSDLFTRPRALAIVDIKGLDQLPVEGAKYTINVDGYDMSSLEDSVAQVFGADRESVSVSKNGFVGSRLAQTAGDLKVDESVIKVKDQSLREELIQIYKLVAALNNLKGAKIQEFASPDIFRITINGLDNVAAADYNTAVSDVRNAVDALTSAFVKVYGGQAVVEVVSESKAIQNKDNSSAHNVVKRAAPADLAETPKMRSLYNVTVFTSPDYPAIFAIFAGLSIILALAVLYIAVGIWNMDPGRDSIIYRMTTTRMKKD